MAGKKKSVTARSRQVKQRSSNPVGIVVRRGALRRFDALTRKTAKLPVVLLWDRRQTDRRASAEASKVDHRYKERRQKPPFTWEVADFLVVDSAAVNGDGATSAVPKGVKRPAAARPKKRGKGR